MSNAEPELHCLVYSFNRGDFLRNCVNSILTCIPFARITVWDDNSTDPLTLSILRSLPEAVEVQTSPFRDGGGIHGGLYDNMQLSLRSVSPDAIVCAMQDDMQVVRPVGMDELRQWDAQLSSGVHTGFMHPVFLKNLKDPIRYRPDADGYLVDRMQRSAGAFYSDIFMIKKSMLDAVNWTFNASEAVNEQQARQHFQQMLYLRNPFVAWLPAVPAWRGKRRTWALRHAEKTRQCGLYPFHLMTSEQAAQFCQRPADLLPWAETYLSLTRDGLVKPWFYQPLQRRPILRQIHKAELELRQLLQRPAKPNLTH